jgi:cell division septation protein DedD
MAPTITSSDYRIRIVAFATRDEANHEARDWRRDGYRTSIIVRNGVVNLIVTAG